MSRALSRRSALGAISMPIAAAALLPTRTVSGAELSRRLRGREPDPERAARDEDLWREVQQAFTQDRSIINFNNGGVSPAPRIAQDAMKRHLDLCNSMPPPHVLWQIAPKQREAIRSRLARHWGVDAEEIAITRNASESLQVCQFGLDLKPGDEVLTTDQDYPRMINTFKQRQAREGIKLVEFPVPTPLSDPPELVRRFAEHITPRTRMILCCHMINLTGQILPIREIAALGRRHGIPVVVDGAHALAHFPFKLSDLGVEYYGTSLHKWLFAPHGTGLLYVKRDRIADLWPLMAAGENQRDDIRKFEEIGTHPAANFLAIAEAMTFHEAIGDDRKAARMRYLRDRWMDRLAAHPSGRVRFNTDRRHACGIANFFVKGLDAGDLRNWLWNEHRILTVAIGHADCTGIRVSPSVYSTIQEVDRFCDAVEHAIEKGVA